MFAMHPTVRNVLIFIFTFAVLFGASTFGLAYVWHNGGFRWVYQLTVSGGLLLCAFYFFLMSKGGTSKGIVWGLVFLMLSPLAYWLSNIAFWGTGNPSLSVVPYSVRRTGTQFDIFWFLSQAEIAPRIPAIGAALLVLLASNGVWIVRGVPRRQLLGGNILMLAFVVVIYFLAYIRIR